MKFSILVLGGNFELPPKLYIKYKSKLGGNSKLPPNKIFKIVLCLLLNFNIFSQSPNLPHANQLLENAIVQLESANYDSSQTLTKKALQLFTNNANQDEFIADCHNNLGRIAMRKDQFQIAIKEHEKAQKIREKTFGKSHFKVASSFNNLGNCYLQLSNFEKAIFYHKKALQIRQSYKNEKPLDLAKSYNNLGSTYYRMQDLGVAFQYFSVALQIREQVLEANDPQLARTQMNIGNCFLANSSFEESLEYFEKALQIFQTNYEKGHPDVADVFFNIGNALFGRKSYTKAIQNYENALQIQTEIYGSQSLKTADIYQNIGNAFAEKGDYVLALQYFENAKSIREQLLPTNHPDFATSFEAIGLSFLEDGDAQKGLTEQRKVLQIRRAYFEEKSRAIGGTYSNIGNTYLQLEKPDSAIFFYKKAEKSLTQDPISLAQNFNNLGICFSKKEDWKIAFDYFDKAINISSDYGLNSPNYWKNAGITLLEMNKNEEANLRFQTALNLLEFTDKEAITNFDALPELIEILGARAALYYKNHKKENQKGWLEKSISDYETAIDLMDKLRLTFSESGSQQKILENNFQIFDGLIECYFEQIRRTGRTEWMEKAFAISEKSKSLVLLEAIRKSNAEKFAGIPDSLLQKEENLKTDIAFFEQQKKEALQYQDAESAQIFTQKIFNAKEKQRTLITQFETDFPQYFQLKYDAQILTISEIQNTLIEENQGILEYFIGEKDIYIFLITKSEFRVFNVRKDFLLEDWVAQIRRSLYFYPSSGTKEAQEWNDQYLETAFHLFEKIIPKYDLPERLIIIPDGALNFLPYEVLLTEIPERKIRFKSHKYFLHQHQISYSYSAHLLKEMRKGSTEKKLKQLAAFAPDFENNTNKLGILKHNKKEIEALSKIYSSDNFFNENATLKQFLEIAESYKILHLATHGKANVKAGEYSFLAFTEIKDSTANLLYVKDLFNQKLLAEMVVLSACETGIGEFQYGEGVVSLARGFSYAGAKSIITSLWSVNDAATADLMQFFYQNLSKGMTKDMALHQAKIQFLGSRPHDEAHPFFWAGFIPIGEMSAIESGAVSYLIWGILGAGFLFVVLLYRNRRKQDDHA